MSLVKSGVVSTLGVGFKSRLSAVVSTTGFSTFAVAAVLDLDLGAVSCSVVSSGLSSD